MPGVPPQCAARIDRPRVVIVDKSPIVRQGLKDILGQDRRFNVVGIVDRGDEFLKLVAERPIDVGIVGWSLPDMTGGDVLSELKHRRSKTRVIIYTGEPSARVLWQAIRLGARAFVSKRDEPAKLLVTITTVAQGRLSLPYIDVQALNPLDDITSRERELLSALASGLTNFQIASRFGISPNTVKSHLKNLYDKLGVNNRAMAITVLLSEHGDKK